ncbi:PadR family transcriptional regulator [Williamsia sp. Leaf354]|uniref:PadR family transcriptional regulator n=1 Tax=Williamsia sp. Leaf354 TaxID=1736349 RepID=UPI0006FFD741|nr:PadR family transcriptional regulator [Williamsia sp. Leaf354]KQS00561.1 PadR family transcriptional regulator [Williamsia sp. Leaf354]
MALRNALLAALADGESSGYDLAKSFDVAVANFWSATPQQLYRELDRLETDGLVEGHVIEQTNRPNKRVFSLTDAGRGALHDFIARPPKATAIRDELLVQVEAMEPADFGAVRSHLQTTRAASVTRLGRYQRSRELLLGGRTEEQFLAETDRLGHFLTLARGIAFEEETVRWCDYVLTVVATRLD